MASEISGSHGGKYEDGIVQCHIFVNYLTFAVKE
jgi:hypothetical protein